MHALTHARTHTHDPPEVFPRESLLQSANERNGQLQWKMSHTLNLPHTKHHNFTNTHQKQSKYVAFNPFYYQVPSQL